MMWQHESCSKECKVAANVECRNCKKTGHVGKICASHIFGTQTGQHKLRKYRANLVKQGENSYMDNKHETAQAMAISRRVHNASPVYRC